MADTKPVVVVGAGLCGTLAALILAEKGFRVEVYEKRPHAELFADSGRSFNITLTERGMRGLRLLRGTLEKLYEPAKGRYAPPQSKGAFVVFHRGVTIERTEGLYWVEKLDELVRRFDVPRK